MFRRRQLIPLMGLLTLLSAAEPAHAQRGRGGARPGGGGMARPAGGGMARPAGGGMTRPAMPQNRPAMARPSMPMNRPSMPQNRPNMGNMAQNRPNVGNLKRPSTLPGGIGGNRPGLGGNRPTPLPGPPGGNRPGLGGNRPGLGGNRPTPLPGPIGGNRPGLGSGNRPGWAGNRPGGNGGSVQWPGTGGGNRPGWANNRPGWANNRPGWANNRPGSGNSNNWGIGNGSGNGNWGIGGGNNINSGNTIVNNNNNSNYWMGGGWGGDRGYSSGYNSAVINNINYGGGGWGSGYGGGWGGGYGSRYYGNWYRGGWGGNGFWAGFGTGALTSFGMGALGSVLGYGGYGYPSYYSGYGVYDYFPTWGASNYTGWGLGSMASNWLYSGYTNPYNAIVIATQPAQTTVVYDYSQPINVTAEAPNPATESSTEQVFSAARDAFKAGDFQRALDLTDQVLKDTPNVPVVHEFRALCLFALKRYDEAAAVDYTVLSAGPGWNWSTLVGLYPDVDTYTNQLRALEASVKTNPNSPATEFLLAYQYLVQGHQDAAASQFEKVTQLQPSDQLSASFVKALKKVSEQPAGQPAQVNVAATEQPAGATAPPAQPAAEQPQQPEPPPPPPASLVGTWKAQPSADLSIALTLQADGQFAWEVDSKGQKQTLTGQAGYKDNTLALLQENGPPLVGKLTEEGGTKFVFTPSGGQKAPGLTFTKS